MYQTKTKPDELDPRAAIIVTYPIRYVAEEAKSLAESAGYSIREVVTQRHLTRSTYGIGKGKAQEVSEIVRTHGAKYVIFDEVLKPTQQYNLASLCKVDVIDRERLILEMFSKRSSTGESRIQIALAHLHYDIVRIKEKVRLAKLGEQPGFLGLGKYDAEVHILDIKRRIAVLKQKLTREESRKLLHRLGRDRQKIPTISIAGYTSSGKTTLFNKLTGETKLVSSELFTTLSAVSRSMILIDSKVIVTDTVGFISKLPAYLIDAFKSTLLDLIFANLVLLILDISNPFEVIQKHLSSCLIVFNYLQISLGKIVYVLNKADLVTQKSIFRTMDLLGIPRSAFKSVIVSAKTGMNLDSLINTMELRLSHRIQDERTWK